MIIDIKREICQVPPNKRQVNAITKNDVPKLIKLTPAKKYFITVPKPQLIERNLCSKNRGLELLNKKVAIFDCKCLYTNTKLCSACDTEQPYMSYVQTNNNKGIIRIKYQPQIIQNLYPGKDFLQGILVSEWENFQSEHKMQNISLTKLENLQPSGWQYDGNNIEYRHSQLTTDNIIKPNYQNNELDNKRFEQFAEREYTACKKNKLLLFIR